MIDRGSNESLPSSGSADEALDKVLVDPDSLLAVSLRHDEKRRQRRWIWLSTVSTLLLATAGWGIATSYSTRASAAGVSSDKTAEGWALWRQRQLDAAELAFLDALRLNETDADAWCGVGWCRNNRGQHERAIEAFEKCLALNAKHSSAINGVGQSNLALGRWKKAEKWLLKGSMQVLAESDEDEMPANFLPAAWIGLTQVYIMQEKYDEAEEWAKRIVKVSPEAPQVASLLDQATKKDNTELNLYFDKIRQAVESRDASQALARGQNSEAIKKYRSTLKSDPENVAAINGLAFALLNSGDHKQAKPLFEKCLSLNPKHYGAVNGLARCHMAAGNADEAVRLWEKMCREVKGAHAGTAGLGVHYFEIGEYEKAIGYLEQLTDSGAHFRTYLKRAKDELAKQEGASK
ncbi:MAG: hypothetical protein Aurels2KO_03950 [Aureliella sp.]